MEHSHTHLYSYYQWLISWQKIYVSHQIKNIYSPSPYKKCLLTSGLLNNYWISLRQIKTFKTNYSILPLLHFLIYSCTFIFLLSFQCHTPSSFPRDTQSIFFLYPYFINIQGVTLGSPLIFPICNQINSQTFNLVYVFFLYMSHLFFPVLLLISLLQI